jgi:hypothetical protein
MRTRSTFYRQGHSKRCGHSFRAIHLSAAAAACSLVVAASASTNNCGGIVSPRVGPSIEHHWCHLYCLCLGILQLLKQAGMRFYFILWTACWELEPLLVPDEDEDEDDDACCCKAFFQT